MDSYVSIFFDLDYYNENFKQLRKSLDFADKQRCVQLKSEQAILENTLLFDDYCDDELNYIHRLKAEDTNITQFRFNSSGTVCWVDLETFLEILDYGKLDDHAIDEVFAITSHAIEKGSFDIDIIRIDVEKYIHNWSEKIALKDKKFQKIIKRKKRLNAIFGLTFLVSFLFFSLVFSLLEPFFIDMLKAIYFKNFTFFSVDLNKAKINDIKFFLVGIPFASLCMAQLYWYLRIDIPNRKNFKRLRELEMDKEKEILENLGLGSDFTLSFPEDIVVLKKNKAKVKVSDT